MWKERPQDPLLIADQKSSMKCSGERRIYDVGQDEQYAGGDGESESYSNPDSLRRKEDTRLGFMAAALNSDPRPEDQDNAGEGRLQFLDGYPAGPLPGSFKQTFPSLSPS